MHSYPRWKYVLVVLSLILGFLYTLPNFYGESPAVQLSSLRTSLKVNERHIQRIEEILDKNNIQSTGIVLDSVGAKIKFANTELQLKAKDLLEKEFNKNSQDPDFILALNLLPASPSWLTALHANPMYLGLDLRGGVHFLLQVDMNGAIKKKMDSFAGEVRSILRDQNIRHAGITKNDNSVIVKFSDTESMEKGKNKLSKAFDDLTFSNKNDNELIGVLNQTSIQKIQTFALQQNINTLHNRINELGVAEPVIQQQGLDRIVVQLPGVQDTAKAKDILGRTAILEIRMVDDSPESDGTIVIGKSSVREPTDLLRDRNGASILVKKNVVLSGERLTDAQPGYDQQNGQPVVHLTLDSSGAKIFKDVTRENVGKRMAIVLIEKNKAEVVTAPVIQQEIGGGRVQISGSMDIQEANDVALLLRAGALAAPMDIIEERTIGPSLGADNIQKGFHSTLWGFVAIATFMIVYYRMFGVISVVALGSNLLLLVAILSLLQATMTLPGIAAIALTLGMAIDSNVLINERIREELKNGTSPSQAIVTGYEKAFDTILDSNITTLIAGLALLIFGSGAVRGFAVVHCLGILTSIFSSVVVSRSITQLIYGQKKIGQISIGVIAKQIPKANISKKEKKA